MGWFLYFNWIPAVIAFGLMAVALKRTNGLIPIILAIVLQGGAFALHWTESQRLAGQPDRLYVWILPLILAVASIPMILLAFGCLASRRANQENSVGGS